MGRARLNQRRKCGPKPMPPHFTRREEAILNMLPDPNLSDVKEMAFALGVNEPMFKWHLTSLYRKIGLQGGTIRLATIWAMTHEHISPGPC